MTTKARVLGLAVLLVSCSAEPTPVPAEDAAAPGASWPRNPASGSSGGELAAASSSVSRFSSLGDCRVLETRPEEAGYVNSLCPGAGGYTVRLIDADARQNLFVKAPDGTETSLALSEAGGGGFSRIGDRIEWRGASDNTGAFRPDSMILRYFVVEAEGEGEVSYLFPVKLGAGGPCVAGRVPPGPGQNERARQTADGPMRCLSAPS